MRGSPLSARGFAAERAARLAGRRARSRGSRGREWPSVERGFLPFVFCTGVWKSCFLPRCLPGVPEEDGGPPAPTLGHPVLRVSGSRRGRRFAPGGPLNAAVCTQPLVPARPGLSCCSAAPQFCPPPPVLTESSLIRLHIATNCRSRGTPGFVGQSGHLLPFTALLGRISCPSRQGAQRLCWSPRDLPWQARIPAPEYITFRISPSPTPTPTPPYAELVPLLAPFPPPPCHGQQHPEPRVSVGIPNCLPSSQL